jgi:predicted RNA-binding Zn-ribbon protein involved in translation (DUF1610 family)
MPCGDLLLSAFVEVKYQQLMRRFICPVCGESGSAFMDTPEKGLHCKYCGWDEGIIPVPFIPRLPEGKSS